MPEKQQADDTSREASAAAADAPAPVGSKLPVRLFIGAIVLAAFAYGALVGKYQLFPYSVMSATLQALRALPAQPAEVAADDNVARRFLEFTDVAPPNAAANRIRFLKGSSLGGPVLWFGGPFEFLDLCPDWGCIAVEYAADGSLAHAYPLRPDELLAAWNSSPTGDEELFGSSESFIRDFTPFGVHPYANGDLLAVFLKVGAGLAYGGIARLDRDGRPIWFQRDGSHHWAELAADGSAIVPGRIYGKPMSPQLKTMLADPRKCDADSFHRSSINFIDEDGSLLRNIDLVDALLDSPYAYVLAHSYRLAARRSGRRLWVPCNLVHLNFASRLREDAGGAWGLAAGDIVVSMRNLSAFAILDARSGAVKRVVRGGFFRQHSVQHLEGSKFVMFDNLGGDGVYGPSRVLAVDLADGRETTLFPNDRTPEHLRRLLSHASGHISISPDRRRAIAAFAFPALAVEFSLEDGEALSVFRSLHDVSGVDDVANFTAERSSKAATFITHGIEYVRHRI